MTIAARLRAIRESLPHKLSVREVSAAMGKPDAPNTYGYYEGNNFTRAVLPLEKAQAIAAIFARHGGDPREVLRLSGLEESDVEQQASSIDRSRPAAVIISLPVALPSEDRLIAMMQGMLDSAGLPHLVDEYAAQLARLLPAALAEAASPASLIGEGSRKRPAAPSPDPAKAGPGKQL